MTRLLGNVLDLEMCLLDLEVGAVYVAVCSIVKDDPLKLFHPGPALSEKWRFGDRNDESIVGNDTSCTSPISYLFPLTPGPFIPQFSWSR